MFLGRLLRLLFWLLLVAWIGWLARRLFSGGRPGAGSGARRAVPGRQRLYRDPACGRFVAAELSHPWRDGGRTLHFCSPECRDRYRGERVAARG